MTTENGIAFLRAEADGLEPASIQLFPNHWKKPPAVPGILEKMDSIAIDTNPVDGIL